MGANYRTSKASKLVRQIDGRDGRIFLQRLSQGLEAAADQGWRLDFSSLPSNPDHWNPENTWHWSETCVKFSDTKFGTQPRNRQLLTTYYNIYIVDNSPWTEMNDRFPSHSRPCGIVVGLSVNDSSACVRFSPSFPKGNFWILRCIVTSRFWQCKFCFVFCQFPMIGFGAS